MYFKCSNILSCPGRLPFVYPVFALSLSASFLPVCAALSPFFPALSHHPAVPPGVSPRNVNFISSVKERSEKTGTPLAVILLSSRLRGYLCRGGLTRRLCPFFCCPRPRAAGSGAVMKVTDGGVAWRMGPFIHIPFFCRVSTPRSQAALSLPTGESQVHPHARGCTDASSAPALLTD